MAMNMRILKETAKLAKNPDPGIYAKPFPDNLRYFDVRIAGPKETPYEGGIFKLELYIPEDYPMTAPKVRFLTKIYHCNIDKLGRICMDVLKGKWSPALQIRTILLSIQSLLSSPNYDDPLDETIGSHFRGDLEGAKAQAAEWTAKYAKAQKA